MEIFLFLLVGLGVLLLLTPLLIKKPWESLMVFGVFLLLQDYLHAVVADPVAKQVIKNADEFFIWHFFLLSILFSKQRKMFLPDYLVLGMLGTGLASSYINAVKPVIIVSDIVLMFKFYALFRAITLQNFTLAHFASFTRLVLIAGLCLFLYGAVEVIAPDQIKSFVWGKAISALTIDERFGITSANGIFVHPGFYGTFMAIAAALALGQFLVLNQKKYIVLFSIFVIGILFSMRRKPLFGLLLAILIFLFFNYRRVASIRRSAIATICAGILLFGFVFQDKITEMVQSAVANYFTTETAETQARDVLYFISAEISVDRFPLGVGLGRFAGFISFKYYSDVYYEYGINKVYGLSGEDPDASFGTDTFWPYVLGELGVIGFFCFAFIIYKFTQYGLQTVRRSTDLGVRSFAIGAYIILLESFFEAFASPIYANSITIFFVFVPIALVVRWLNTNPLPGVKLIQPAAITV